MDEPTAPQAAHRVPPTPGAPAAIEPPGSGAGTPGAWLSVLVRSGETAGRLGVARVRAAPGEVLRPHRHAREDEIAVVLDGTLRVVAGADEVRTVGPDTSLVLPAGEPHAMVAGPAGVDLLLCFLPGGLEDLLDLLRERPRSADEDDDAAALLTAAGVGLLPRRRHRSGPEGRPA